MNCDIQWTGTVGATGILMSVTSRASQWYWLDLIVPVLKLTLRPLDLLVTESSRSLDQEG